MKRIQIILGVTALALVVLMSSCSKDLDKVLVKKEGKWNIDRMFASDSTLSANSHSFFELELPNAGSVTFNSDGTATQTITFGGSSDTETFKWAYDDAAEKMTFTDYDGETFTMDVLENTNKVQKWTHTSTVVELDSFLNEDVTTISILEFDLSR